MAYMQFVMRAASDGLRCSLSFSASFCFSFHLLISLLFVAVQQLITQCENNTNNNNNHKLCVFLLFNCETPVGYHARTYTHRRPRKKGPNITDCG